MKLIKPPLNHKNFEIARISRGLSQKELAIKLQVEQSTISKIEKGLSKIKEELLEKYCFSLDYPPSFFSENINILSPYLIYFRKRKVMSTLELDTIQCKLFINKHWVKKLLKSVDIKNSVPFVDINKGNPKDIAKFIRNTWNIPRGRIDNLTHHIEKSGIVILLTDGNEKFDGEILPDEDGLPVICINKKLSGDRQRFTLAHELGHLVMHTDIYQDDLVRAEKEANEFASEFLMPERDIYAHLQEKLTIQRLADLKSYWKVSMSSIIMRAYHLGVINKAKYTSMQVQLSQAGYRKKEPDLGVLPEQPQLVGKLISLHLNELGFSKQNLATMLSLSLVELEFLIKMYNGERTLKILRNYQP